MRIEQWPIHHIIPFENNARIHDEKSINAIGASVDRFDWLAPIVVDKEGVVIAGHGRLEAAKRLGLEEAPVLVADWLTDNEVAAAREADNMTQDLSYFDWDALNINLAEVDWLDIDMTEFGFKLDDELGGFEARDVREAIDSDTREDSEEYREFVEKFEPKKTTDDCFTPPTIYELVRDWACKEYGIDPEKVVRPFYPGGDYQRFEYPEGCCVLDNPPFSILSEIQRFYVERGIDFFLFAPYLSNLSTDIPEVNHIICDVDVIYDNGAVVNTCFLTTLGDDFIASAPDLNALIRDEVKRLQKDSTANLPKYEYPPNVITATRIGYIANNGVDFRIKRSECHFTRALDSQREMGKAIFGAGYLISDAARDRIIEAEAEAKARFAEKRGYTDGRESIVWDLSDREREIIKGLD